MPQLTFNITTPSTTTLITGGETAGSSISRISICNTSGIAVTFSLVKTLGTQSCMQLNGITLQANQSFIYENLFLPPSWNLNLVASGSLDIDVLYTNPLKTPW